MYIDKVHLTHFKRFYDLEIDLSTLPTPPKLVLLIGANGSGKSSVFDAFGLAALAQKDAWQSYAPEYYPKSGESSFSLRIEFSSGQLYDMKSRFHAAILAPLNLTTKALVQTIWFRRAISDVFGGE